MSGEKYMINDKEGLLELKRLSVALRMEGFRAKRVYITPKVMYM